MWLNSSKTRWIFNANKKSFHITFFRYQNVLWNHFSFSCFSFFHFFLLGVECHWIVWNFYFITAFLTLDNFVGPFKLLPKGMRKGFNSETQSKRDFLWNFFPLTWKSFVLKSNYLISFEYDVVFKMKWWKSTFKNENR